jgi:sucrose-6-phosphate hydrolase SacC (GH32 family)
MALQTDIGKQAQCFQLAYDTGPRYVNDHCFICDANGLMHLFHITGPAGKRCYDPATEITFGHATSSDLKTWTAHPDVLSIDPTSQHEPHHLFAPYVTERAGTYFMFYSGINRTLKSEAMCLATSTNLFTWHKHSFNPIFRPSRHWADHTPGSNSWACCRDAHVLSHPDHGYILYYVTWLKNTNGRLVTFGAAVSNNLTTWQDVGPVMIRERATDYSTTSMESPCVIAHNNQYYLFYKHRNETRLVISNDPLNFTDKEDHYFSIAHAAEIFLFNNQWYISSCSRDLQDVAHKHTDRTRGLYLAQFDWIDEIPHFKARE